LTGGRNAFAIAPKLAEENWQWAGVHYRKKGSTKHNQERWNVNKWTNAAT
jgi:hypothetical protein